MDIIVLEGEAQLSRLSVNKKKQHLNDGLHMQGRQKKASSAKLQPKQPVTRRRVNDNSKPVWQLAAEARILAGRKDWRQLSTDLSIRFEDEKRRITGLG